MMLQREKIEQKSSQTTCDSGDTRAQKVILSSLECVRRASCLVLVTKHMEKSMPGLEKTAMVMNARTCYDALHSSMVSSTYKCNLTYFPKNLEAFKLRRQSNVQAVLSEEP